MKKVLLIVVLLVMVAGCERLLEYQDGSGGTLTSEQYQLLPAAEQAKYLPVQMTRVDRETMDRVGTGLNVAKGVQEQWGGLLGPWGELAGGVISLALIATGIVKQIKLVKTRNRTQTILANVEAGARITAESVEKIFRPGTDLWEQFTALQDSKRDKMRGNPDAPDPIMPDEV